MAYHIYSESYSYRAILIIYIIFIAYLMLGPTGLCAKNGN